MRDLGDFIRYLADRDFSPASVVDVGACYGTPELFRNLPEARHVFIEPLPEMAARLEMLSRKYRGEYHQVALSDHEGSVRIGYNSAPDAASMAYSDVNHEHSHEVRVTTLDHLFHGSSWERPLLLKTDCQGYDLDVLRGGSVFLEVCDIIVCEVNLYHAAGKADRPVFSDIVCFLKGRGFEVFDILSYKTRPRDGALGYVDLAFVRADGPLWRHHSWV